MLKVYSDAAIKPQTKQCGIGILVANGKQQFQIKRKMTAPDNHQAEFLACITAFNLIANELGKEKINPKTVNILYYTDSQILQDSLTKHYAKHYQNLVNQALAAQSPFKLVVNNWIPDSQNRGAHELAYQALHFSQGN